MNDIVQLVNENYEYVQSVNEVFWIVTYTTDYRRAKQFYRDHANDVLRNVSLTTNGHVNLRITN